MTRLGAARTCKPAESGQLDSGPQRDKPSAAYSVHSVACSSMAAGLSSARLHPQQRGAASSFQQPRAKGWARKG